MRTKFVVSATAAFLAAGFTFSSGGASAGSCAPGSVDGQQEVPAIAYVPIPSVGNVYVYSTIPDNPFGRRHRGAAGFNGDAAYVELFGAAPTQDGHVHGEVYGTPVNFDVALGERSFDPTPASVTRVCVAGNQIIGDDYGYTPPAP